MCNSDLPNDSTLNRYLFVIEYYVSQVRSSAWHDLVLLLKPTGLYRRTYACAQVTPEC